MVDKEAIREFQDKMWRWWGGTDDHAPPCIMCWKPAICLHEIDPRSTNRDWYKRFPNPNSVPMCNSCHRDAEEGELDKDVVRKATSERLISMKYTDWDLENPPRESKSGPPDHVVDGKGVFDIQRSQKKRRDKNG